MSKFFTIYFWINNEPFLKSTLIIAFVFFSMFFFIGILAQLRILRNKGDLMNDFYKKTAIASFVMSFIGYFLIFFSYQRINYLGMRLNYILWLIGLCWWSWILFKRYKILYDQKIKFKRKEEIEKYLPKSKKK